MCAVLLLAVASGTRPTRALAAPRQETVSVPFTYVDNRMTVECMLDGRGPFVMVVDTGSPDVVITPATAKQIEASVRNGATTTGAGNKQVPSGNAKLATLSIASLSFHNVEADVIDLTEIRTKLGFPRLDGIIGYAILKQFAAFVNVDAGTISFARTPPNAPADATATPFKGVIPEIAAQIDGVATTVLVDTGDRSSLTLFGPFAKANRFYGRYPSHSDVITGYGLGGPVYGDVFTLPSLNVLGTHLGAVVTRASRQTAGVFTGSDQGGSIGGGVLKRFNIVYDYPNERMIAWPSKYFDVPDAFVPPPHK
jgi:predicted aspartyl protease